VPLARSLVPNPQAGAVAQLGERLICIQEVAGSIPTSSTSLLARVCSMALLVSRDRQECCVPVADGPVAQLARAHP
jgi:hypothetical protein